MKKLLFSLILGLLISGKVYAQSSYKANGISFFYPENWGISHVQQYNKGFDLSLTKMSNKAPAFMTINWENLLYDPQKTVLWYFDQFAKEMGNDVNQLQKGEIVKTKQGKWDAVQLNFSYVMENEKFLASIVAFQPCNKTVTYCTLMAEKVQSLNAEDLKLITESIRCLDQEEIDRKSENHPRPSESQ